MTVATISTGQLVNEHHHHAAAGFLLALGGLLLVASVLTLIVSASWPLLSRLSSRRGSDVTRSDVARSEHR